MKPKRRRRLYGIVEEMERQRNKMFQGKVQCLIELQLAAGLPFLRCVKKLCHRGKHEFHNQAKNPEIIVRW